MDLFYEALKHWTFFVNITVGVYCKSERRVDVEVMMRYVTV